jgi:hypothetical protein
MLIVILRGYLVKKIKPSTIIAIIQDPTSHHSIYFFLAYFGLLTILYHWNGFRLHLMCDDSTFRFFANPLSNMVDRNHEYFYGSILYIWLGHVLRIDSMLKLQIMTSALYFLAALGLYGLAKLHYPDDKRATRFIAVIFSSIFFAILASWLGLSDPILFILYLALFFTPRHHRLTYCLVILMVLTHKEQTLFLVLCHSILALFEKSQQKQLWFIWAGVLSGWGLSALYLHHFGFHITNSRIDLVMNYENTRPVLMSNLGKLLPRGLYSVYGAAWIFFFIVFQRAPRQKKLQLIVVTVIPLGLALMTRDFIRVIGILSLPALCFLADMNARNNYFSEIFSQENNSGYWSGFYWLIIRMKW